MEFDLFLKGKKAIATAFPGDYVFDILPVLGSAACSSTFRRKKMASQCIQQPIHAAS